MNGDLYRTPTQRLESELRDAEIEIRSLKRRCRHLVEILKDIEGDSVFSGLGDTLKERIYSEIEKDDSE